MPPNSPAGKKKILLVDDHPVVREGVAKLIQDEEDLEICASCGSPREALDQLEKLNPHLAVVDVSLNQGMSGIQLVKELKKKMPQLPVLVLSMHEESLFAARALRAGAKGYLMKRNKPTDILQAIRALLKGEMYFSESVKLTLLQKMSDGSTGSGSPMELLSDREIQVFELIGQGESTKEVADTLNLSVKTVETYREKIKEKLQLKNATELVQRAAQWVQFEDPDE